MSVSRLALVLLVLGAPAWGQGFAEVALDLGIDHVHEDPVLIGGGVALFDYDNDGDLDVYLTGGRGYDALYRNDGAAGFAMVSFDTGVGVTQHFVTVGVATADIDNDGDRDVFLATGRGSHDRLLRNEGDGTFLEASAVLGLAGASAWSTSASFGDVNLDGWVDLYVTRYIEEPSLMRDASGEVVGYDHGCYADVLYLNDGDGTFTEQAEALGLAHTGCGLATTFSDVDGDADPDLFVVNDFGAWVEANRLLRNDTRPGSAVPRLTGVAAEMGADLQIYGMGIAPGDPDGDGDLDYYVTNLGPNVLLEADPAGFADAAERRGVASGWVEPGLRAASWGAAFADLDHDGDEDLVVANGYITAAPMLENAVDAPDRLFLNDGAGVFADHSAALGFDSPDASRGLAVGDLDGDGDLDVVVASVAASGSEGPRARVYRNDLARGHWLAVRVEGTSANRSGVGSRVEVFAEGRRWVREIRAGDSYASQSAGVAHVGLGAATAADSVVVTWPGGARDVRQGVPADQTILVAEGGATDAGARPAPPGLAAGAVHPNPARGAVSLPYRAASPVVLRIHDALGRLVAVVEGGPGAGTLRWDGRAASASGAAAGVYLYALSDGSRTVRGTFTLLP